MPLASCGGKGSLRRYRALAALALRGVRRSLREVRGYQTSEGGEFAFAAELAEKRRQLAEIEADLGDDWKSPDARIAA